MTDEIKFIKVSLIDNPGRDMRIGIDQSKQQDLLESIKTQGILQALLLRPRGERFEVIAGNRRLQAARSLGLEQIPALVRDTNDSDTAILRFEENIKRADVDPVSEARYIAETITALETTVQDFATKIGRSEQYVFDRLMISAMPDYMHEHLIAGTLSLGVALALYQVDDEETRYNWTMHAVDSGMTVRAANTALREYKKLKRAKEDRPEGIDAAPIPATPPTVYVHCVRCRSNALIEQTKLVRIHNPICPVEEG